MRDCAPFVSTLQAGEKTLVAQSDVFRDRPVCADNGGHDRPSARLPTPPNSTPWQANLALRFARAERRHDPRRQPPRRAAAHPEGALSPKAGSICHAIVLHPPAGICGGDQLHIDVEVGAEAQALLTTPGAGKWYRSAGALAEQVVNLKVSRGGTAEWLPQESIVFDGGAGAHAHDRGTGGRRALRRRRDALPRPPRQRRDLLARTTATGDRHPARRQAVVARARAHRGRFGPARFAHRPGRLQRLLDGDRGRCGRRCRDAGRLPAGDARRSGRAIRRHGHAAICSSAATSAIHPKPPAPGSSNSGARCGPPSSGATWSCRASGIRKETLWNSHHERRTSC